MVTRTGAVLILAAIHWVSGNAFAQPAHAAAPAPEDRALRLFNEGKRLLEESKYEQACARFRESWRIEPGGGTALALAVCHEGQGLWASAHRYFAEAQTLALRDGRPDRALIAEQRLADISRRVSYLVLRLPKEVSLPTDATIACDGHPLERKSLRRPYAIDPGEHTITVQATGYRIFMHTVTVGAEAAVREVVVPRLVLHESTAAQATAPSSGTPPWVWAAGGVGAAGLVLGGVLGVATIMRKSAVDGRCPDPDRCDDARAYRLNADAHRLATWSNVGWGVGAIGSSVVLWQLLRARRPSGPPKAEAALHVTGSGTAMEVRIPW